MNWTLAHLKALDDAIALGVRRVQYHDKIVEYASLSDQLRARRLIMAALFPGTGVRNTRILTSVGKGTR